jgi:hypothetical protein
MTVLKTHSQNPLATKALSRAMNSPNGWGLSFPPLKDRTLLEYTKLGNMIKPPTMTTPAQYEVLGGVWTTDREVETLGIRRTIRTVHSLFKVPEAPRGVGAELMLAVIADAKRNRVRLVLDAYDNHKLSSFYSCLGFKPYGYVKFNEEYVSDRWNKFEGYPPVKAWYMHNYEAAYQGCFVSYEDLLEQRDHFVVTNQVIGE